MFMFEWLEKFFLKDLYSYSIMCKKAKGKKKLMEKISTKKIHCSTLNISFKVI